MSPSLGSIRIAVQSLAIRSYPRTTLQSYPLQSIKSTSYILRPRTISSSPSLSSSQYDSPHGAAPASTAAEQQRRQDQAAQEAQGPNMDTLPHISEEAAAVGKAKGEKGPEIEGQGTPVQEVCVIAHK